MYYAPAAYWVKANAGTTVTCQCNTYDSHGNPIAVSSMTAKVRDQSTNTDAGSFSGSSVTGVSANATGNGSDIYGPGGSCTGSPASLRMYLTYTGSAYDQPPNIPNSISPNGGSTVTTLTPVFTGNFSDPTSGDHLAQYQIQVAHPAGAQVWDSGAINASSGEIAAAKFTHTYAGTALSYSTSYWWRCRVANQGGLWSGYTGWQTITLEQGPNAPSAVAPSGQQTSTTPAFSFLYSSPASVNEQSYEYKIYAASGGALVYDSGTIAHNVATGTTVSGTISGAANLQPGMAYTFSIFATDTNSAASPITSTSFNIPALPQVLPASPINNANVNTHTPTFTWSYTDASYPQQSYQIQIYNTSTGALIKDTGVVASAATTYTLSGASITFGTNIRWHIQVVDTAGLASGFSNYAYALVIDTPVVVVTAPANLATIVTNTPTITWTFTASSTGNPQASVSILINDSNGNNLANYIQSGTGLSFTIPVGLLQNNTAYQVQVLATDSGALVGASSTNAFTVAYVAPADMQGQALTNATNYIVSPYLNTDSNSDGVADSWALFSSSHGQTQVVLIDPNVNQGVSMANGDGTVTGAQNLQITAIPGGQTNTECNVYQQVLVATAAFTPNSTHISAAVECIMAVAAGSPYAYMQVKCLDGGGSTLASGSSSHQGDTAGVAVRLLGPQNLLIPTSTVKVEIDLFLFCPTASDLGQAWFFDCQLEAAAASDAAYIAGDLGTGYAYDTNGFSDRTMLAGAAPTIVANPGADTDPVSASGGTITLNWDETLADATRFYAYLVDRRRLDAQEDDTAWVNLATITDSTVDSYTDYTPGGSTVYQYSIRQQITYTDGSVGLSAHRAIVAGSVVYSPAWYLVNTDGLIYNMRLTTIDIKRTIQFKERAVYNAFLGRIGMARDAGPAQGYIFNLIAYFDESFGDVRSAIRRQLYTMNSLNLVWLLKDPAGLVVPVYFQDFQMDDEDTYSDTLMTITFQFVQAADTQDY